MRKPINDFLADARGNAALEYGLVLAAIGVAVVSAVSALGETLAEIYQTVLSGLSSFGSGGPLG